MAHGLKAEKLATLLLDQQRVTLYFACSNFCDFCVFPQSIRKIKFQQKSPPQLFTPLANTYKAHIFCFVEDIYL